MSWVQTANNLAFDFQMVDKAEFPISEIAHALSNLCRYQGHCNRFYSVAEHSYYVSHMVPQEFAFQALMHDGHEAYVGDVPSPLKQLLPDYQKIEDEVEENLRLAYDLPLEFDASVKQADLAILGWEKFHLFGKEPQAWFPAPPLTSEQKSVLPITGPDCVNPSTAYSIFMMRYEELTANE